MGLIKTFQIMVVVMAFFSFSITLIAHGMASTGNALNYLDDYSLLGIETDIDSVSTEVEDSLGSQSDIPVIELGALIFYSGNILLDLLLNFIFAIPMMIGLVVNGLQLLFNIDGYIFAQVEIFASGLLIVLYFIALIQLLMNSRSGTRIS